MRICYVVLSPTFGMHQYAADLANRTLESAHGEQRVSVITCQSTPRDRYAPQIDVQPVAHITGAGLKPQNFNLGALLKVYRAIVRAQPDVVHFTGPHIWNPVLLWLLRRKGIATIHTIHDLDPHSGVSYGRLLYVWNNSIKHLADQILVHNQAYRARLLAEGCTPEHVTYSPLLHLFTSYAAEQKLISTLPLISAADRDSTPFGLFFARLEAYKGVNVLIEAARHIDGRVIIAGKGDVDALHIDKLPNNIEIRNRQINDQEAIELFSTCSLVVLPYLDATQSALIAAAYFFGKPVIVTRVGALPEYVVDGQTGWIIEPRNSQTLAECMQMALRDPAQLSKMGQAGREWYIAQRRLERRTLRLMYDRVHRSRSNIGSQYQSEQGGKYVND